MAKSTTERIEFLRKCAKEYETDGTSPITDAAYDKEYEALQKISPNDPFFSEVGGLDDIHVYGTTAKHDITCGSLNKSANTDDFLVWLKRTFPKLDGLELVVQLKVDGLSLCCEYNDGKLQRVLTRGNGYEGVDVTENAKYVKGIRQTIEEKGEVEVRGEGFKDRKDFYKNWSKDVLGEDDGYALPRNFTAGSINQKDPLETKRRGIAFVAYEIVRMEFKTEVDKVKFLMDNKFSCLAKSSIKIKAYNHTHEKVAQKVQRFMDKIDRATLPFDIDGVVVKVNDIATAQKLGSTAGGKKPKANRAVKFPPEQKETILKGIEWSVGRTGALTPIGLLEPVELGGAIIRRVSLHNISHMTNELGITKLGTKVLVEKAGDIIPKVIEKKADGNKDIDIPDSCPSCKSDLVWDDTDTTKWCHNPNCISQLKSTLDHWFKKIGVKGIGEGIIGRLTEKDILKWEGEPIITSISEMYYKLDEDRQAEHPFRKYAYLKEAFGEKTYENILKSVKSVTEVTLAEFIQALGIGKVGRTAVDITAIAPTVEDIDKLTVGEIVAQHGFADIKARSFVKGWKGMRKEIEVLLKYITISADELDSDCLDGKKFCITGTLSRPRKEIQSLIERNGGKVSGSVSAKLDYLVCGEDCGSKKEKANKLGVNIIEEEELNDLLI